jgi:hypothetical protein
VEPAGIDYELIEMLGYVRSCGFLLAISFVSAAAVFAGAKLKTSIGVWVFAGSMIIYLLVNVVEAGTGLAEIDPDIMQWFYLLTSGVTLALNLAMLIGMSLIKPVPAGDAAEVRQ